MSKQRYRFMAPTPSGGGSQEIELPHGSAAIPEFDTDEEADRHAKANYGPTAFAVPEIETKP